MTSIQQDPTNRTTEGMFFTFMQLGAGSHMMRPRIQEKDTEILLINMEEYWACCGTCVALHNAFTVVIILGLN